MPTPKHLFAYYDTMAGLVPCRVFGIESVSPIYGTTVQIRLTATRGAFKRGEIMTAPAHKVWPRDISFPRRGSYGQRWIVPPYSWHDRLGL